MQQSTQRVDLVGIEKKRSRGSLHKSHPGYVYRLQDRCEDPGTTASFEVGVGLHQGSALSRVLFIIIMDVITENIATTPPRVMLFAGDLALCEETKGEAEQQLDVWRNFIESRGLRVSRQKT